MMKKTIYRLFAATAILTGMAACSDNYDKQLEPVETTRAFTVDIDSEDFNKHDGKLEFNSEPHKVPVKVICNTRWAAKLIPLTEDGKEDENGKEEWCEIDVFNGLGDASFTLSVVKNLSTNRKCALSVYLIDSNGNKISDAEEIIVSQAASAVRLSPSSVEPFPADPPANSETTFEIISNTEWTLTLTYEAGNVIDFVTIIPDTGMVAGDNGSFTGKGDAKFQVKLQSNRTASNRSAFLNLTSELGTSTVELSQTSSKGVFDVSPIENQTIPATGGKIDFSVLSIYPWTVSSDADWIEFSNEGGSGYLQTDPQKPEIMTPEPVTARIKPNAEGYARNAKISFVSTDERYGKMETVVSVDQKGYDLTFSFSVNPNDNLGVILAERQEKHLELDSRFNWKTILPDWITASPSTGEKSNLTQKITLNIAENSTGDKRDGTVIFCPLPTVFEGDVELDPAALGIDSLKVNITQFGGQDPAISVPWLAEGYTQTSATIEFSYYSPFYPISEVGLKWIRADLADSVDVEKWNDAGPKTIDNPTTGKASFDLTGLDPATEYVARGYVIYGNGQTKNGGATPSFTTAGKRPGSDDNPTPRP